MFRPLGQLVGAEEPHVAFACPPNITVDRQESGHLALPGYGHHLLRSTGHEDIAVVSLYEVQTGTVIRWVWGLEGRPFCQSVGASIAYGR